MTTLTLRHRFAAPPGEVFAAWTSPEVLERWWEGDSHTSLMTVEFRPEAEGRLVVLEQSALESEASREQHAAGWQGVLESLEERVFA